MTKKQAKQIATLINKMNVSRMMYESMNKEGKQDRANDWYLSEMEAIASLFNMGIPMINGKEATEYLAFIEACQSYKQQAA
jgi:hypothetical protein